MIDWLYACSSNSAKESLVNSLQSCINISPSSFNDTFPDCIHIKSVVVLLDSMNEIYPEYDFHGMV